MQRKIPTLPFDRGFAGPGAMKSCKATPFTDNKVADFPAVHLCPVLNCPTFLSSSCKTFPLLPWVPHLTLLIPKPPRWPWAHSMSGLGRKSYLADVRHLISYRGKLLCEINTRPSLTSVRACERVHARTHLELAGAENRPPQHPDYLVLFLQAGWPSGKKQVSWPKD